MTQISKAFWSRVEEMAVMVELERYYLFHAAYLLLLVSLSPPQMFRQHKHSWVASATRLQTTGNSVGRDSQTANLIAYSIPRTGKHVTLARSVKCEHLG